MNKTSKIYVAGHRGMVGSAVVRALKARGFENIVTRSRKELDLTSQADVRAFYAEAKPDVAVIAAAKVGGIHANNTYPAEFMFENLAIAQNTIDEAYRAGVGRVLFLGSTCIYPKFAEQPIKEDSLLTSPLEPTNEAYAIAKIAGLKMCQFYRRQYGVLFHSAMPTNLYGPGDNYHAQNSHVLPALMRRFHEAKETSAPEVAIWGTGTPLREFLHADDAADGILHLLQLDNPPDWVNLGCGTDISIGDLARLVMTVTGYQGELTFDTSKPDGTPRKLTDISLIKSTGWEPKIPIEEGVAMAYQSFLKEQADGTLRE
ncbi:GDP-L-fucose synthase family protein [Coraliomargarita parva]|uniref:GDP-L-fucose synthase family protein n=1 Tax=Coraliomargarita parva TaxID=3014050 RepID=UPI0022B46A32|nr:GDP-L-fucose synthase [Coraliomargarita parva]